MMFRMVLTLIATALADAIHTDTRRALRFLAWLFVMQVLALGAVMVMYP